MTKKSTETKKRAGVSPERRLALALRALLDATLTNDATFANTASQDLFNDAERAATALLDELGYKDLIGIPKQVAALEAQLQAATEAKDWKTVAALGTALDRVRLGKSSKVTAPAKEKTPRKPRTPKTNEPGKCITCGNEESDESHSKDSEDFHIFRTEIKKKGKGQDDDTKTNA